MGNFKSQLHAEKRDAATAKPHGTLPIMYENPRQVIYSYLDPKELLKVASLFKKER